MASASTVQTMSSVAAYKDRLTKSHIVIPLIDDLDFAPFYQVLLAGAYRPLTLCEGDIVLDAGANIGVYTALAAKRVGSGGLVISVEPDPSNFEKLRRVVAINRLENVALVRKALWSRSDCRLALEGLGVMASVSAMSEDQTGADGESGGTRVAMSTTIDDLVRALGVARIDKVKMDIEGAEFQVVQSSHSRALFQAKEVCVELHGAENRAIVSRILSAHGFREDYVVEGSEDFLRLLEGLLSHPFLAASLEVAHGFRTTARVIKASTRAAASALLRTKTANVPVIATVHFTKEESMVREM